MSNQENELNQKKTLLKTEIMEKNYDQDSFIHFCMTKKENGDDMNNWTLAELKEAIAQFVQAQKEETKEGSKSKQEDKKKLEEKKAEQQLNDGMEQLKTTTTKVEDKKTKDIEVECRPLDKCVLNDKKITVVLKNPQTIEAGVFQSSYITYEVETTELKYHVKRRYSDFEWLRAMLIKFNPGVIVPMLPHKKMGNRRFEHDFIKKRMIFLQLFMDSVMEQEVFKASEPTLPFLQITERGQFESKMKELNSFIPSTYIEHFKTFSGKVIIASEEEDNEKYFGNIKTYFALQSQLLDRLNDNMSGYYHNIKSAVTNMENMQKDFETLHLLNTRVLMRDNITKTFEEFGIFFKNWSRIVKHQNDLFKTHIKDFFRFIKMEGNAYEEIVKSREEARDKFTSEHSKLSAKKDKLWNQMDVTKWDIIDEFNKIDRALLVKDKAYALSNMCTKESQLVERYKKSLGYLNRMNINELKKMIHIHCEKFFLNLKIFIDKFYPTLTDGINVWSGLMTFYSTSAY